MEGFKLDTYSYVCPSQSPDLSATENLWQDIKFNSHRSFLSNLTTCAFM